jgi:hypothetical protein
VGDLLRSRLALAGDAGSLGDGVSELFSAILILNKT